MTDEELIEITRQARKNAHGSWVNVDGNRATDWSGSSRRLQELLEEMRKRGLSRSLIFGCA